MEKIIEPKANPERTFTSTKLNSKILSTNNATSQARMQNLRQYLFGKKLDTENSNFEHEHTKDYKYNIDTLEKLIKEKRTDLNEISYQKGIVDNKNAINNLKEKKELDELISQYDELRAIKTMHANNVANFNQHGGGSRNKHKSRKTHKTRKNIRTRRTRRTSRKRK